MGLATPSLAYSPNQVSDYAIVSLYQSGPNAVTCILRATFCNDCNPNDANNPGCPEFTHGFPPSPCPAYYDCGIREDGRFAAVRLQKIPGGIVKVNKMILNPTNWPLQSSGGYKHTEAFVFTDVPLSAGDRVEVWGELFCSWCGHWYPCVETLTVTPPPQGAPALSQWGLVGLMLVLLALATWVFLLKK